VADATVDPDVQDGKGLAWLSYLGILFLIPLLAKKENKFCQFHAKQGLVLLIAEIIVSIVFVIPILGWIVGVLGYIFVWIMAIIGIIQSATGKYWKMPVLGGFAEKFNF
jgi:uncharacterized membrane protein